MSAEAPTLAIGAHGACILGCGFKFISVMGEIGLAALDFVAWFKGLVMPGMST